ncbi:MAG: hypothetical protein M0P66_00075 [Salinivirgaceae bacterium]|nr:hypothetical protein [Salinivirgaceae bacterium]
MNLNETLEFRAIASQYWNDTGLIIEPGQTYRFEVSGTWTDSYIDTGADGFDKWFMACFKPFRRSPKNKWFALMGSLDKGKPFLIGSRNEITFDKEGKLYCFANDVKGFYGNNKGEVTLKLKRIA